MTRRVRGVDDYHRPVSLFYLSKSGIQRAFICTASLQLYLTGETGMFYRRAQWTAAARTASNRRLRSALPLSNVF